MHVLCEMLVTQLPRTTMDCEMVGGVDSECEFSMLARCSSVNHHGNILLDKYVKPLDKVTDFRTRFSGIRPFDLKRGEFSHLQCIMHTVKKRVEREREAREKNRCGDSK